MTGNEKGFIVVFLIINTITLYIAREEWRGTRREGETEEEKGKERE